MAPRSITGCYPPVTGSVRAAAIVPPLLACGRSGASGCPAPPPISTYAYRAAPPTPPDVDHRAGSENLQNPDPGGVEVGCRDGEAGGAVAGARGAARRPPPPLLPKRGQRQEVGVQRGRRDGGRPGMRGIEELLTGEGGPRGPRPPAKERTTQGGTPRRPRSGQGRHGSGEGARESEPQRPPATTNRRRRRPSSLACTRRFFSMSFLSSLHPPPLCVFSARAAVASAALSQALHLDRLIRCILSS